MSANIRFKIVRDDNPYAQTTGTVEFSKLENAEKAYAICNDYYFEQHRCTLRLHISEDASLEPVPNAQIRQVKQLSANTDNATLYNLFRPFGPVHSAKLQLDNGRFRGFALVRMFEENDAERATSELHCMEVDGMMIAVVPFNPRSKLTPLPPEFIPSQPNAWSQKGMAQSPSSPGSPSTPAGSTAGSAGLVDPCNLFIKNLDPLINSNDLFNNFRQFGRIVSARVMREEETGNSRGFGFVSFTQPDEAARALAQMNGSLLGTKNIVVRLHEPKKVREAKLAQRFAGDGAAAPTPPPSAAPSKHSKRNSNSYFKAIMAGQSSDLDIDTLSALAPPVRKELLSAELSKRVRDLPTVAKDDVDPLVEILVELKLQDVMEAIDNPVNLIEKVHDAKEELAAKRTAEPVPAPVAAATSSPPAPASPVVGTESERMLAAVQKIDPVHAVDISELLMALSKPERAKCFFSQDYLRSKVQEAQAILETTQDDEPGSTPISSAAPTVATSSPAQSLGGANGLDKSAVDPKITAETDRFVDSLQGRPIHEQKQKLGDRLFKVVKGFGVKNAPKITIHLLDTEDLRALAHMMNQPDVLRKKVDAIAL